MKMKHLLCGAAMAAAFAITSADAQQAGFAAGMPLGVMANGKHTPMSNNVKVYGALVFSESCSYDPARNLIVAINRGAPQNIATNDGFVSLINHDGSVHTPLWIGATRNGLTLNDPLGSDVMNGKLYVADKDGGTADGAAPVNVVRTFDLKTGAPAGDIRIEGSVGFNDVAVAKDGTLYGTQTGGPTIAQRVYKVTPDGKASVLIEGAPLARPNGIALDNDGNIVVVNLDSAAVITFSPDGKLVKTEQASMPGNDGLVILADGTKYVSSVMNGGMSRIRGGKAELVATGIPSPASICYDSQAKQIVIPMNPNNALGFLKVE